MKTVVVNPEVPDLVTQDVCECIDLPTPETPAHAAALALDVPGARLRISTRPLAGPKALVSFGGNAEEPVSQRMLIAPFESILTIAKRVAPFLPMGLVPMRDTQKLADAVRPSTEAPESARIQRGTMAAVG